MIDSRLRRHPLGFLEAVDRPSRDDLAEYYASTYYQVERGNYRHSYPSQELAVKMLRIEQRTYHALSILNGRGERRPLEGPLTYRDTDRCRRVRCSESIL